MAILKILLSLLITLAALLLLGGQILSPKFSVTREIDIQAPPEKVYALVAAPKAWVKWDVWNHRDPAMTVQYSGPESGAGAIWSWQSRSQGNGRITITRAETPERVDLEFFFPDDFGTSSSSEFLFTVQGGQTHVRWSMQGDMGKNPLFHWMALFGDKMIGPDFEAGLRNLKALSEKS